MTIETELKEILLKRMSQEYEDFLSGLYASSPAEIIQASYEKVFKEDILSVVECGVLDAECVKALLKEKYPLDGCYQRWLDEDVTYMEDLRYCMEDYARSTMRGKHYGFESRDTRNHER